ncbi:MAG: aryl-sulfate sulfotransferase, partial [bacterium]
LDRDGNLIPTTGAFYTWGLSEGTFHVDEDGDLTPTEVIVPPTPGGGNGPIGYKATATTINVQTVELGYVGEAPEALSNDSAIQFDVKIIRHERVSNTFSSFNISGSARRFLPSSIPVVTFNTQTQDGANYVSDLSIVINSASFIPEIRVVGKANSAINWFATLAVSNKEVVPAIDIVLGCTDPTALNYNPAAQFNNGSCQYAPVQSVMVLPVSVNSEITSLNVSHDGGQSMFPSFDPAIKDYAVKTALGWWGNLNYTVTAGGQTITGKAQTNRVLEISDSFGGKYYVRFLPSDISSLCPNIVQPPAQDYEPGLYLYGAAQAGYNYYMVFSAYGVPMWYISSDTANGAATPYSVHKGSSINRILGNNTNGATKETVEIGSEFPTTTTYNTVTGDDGGGVTPDIHDVQEVITPGRNGNILILGYGSGMYIQEFDPVTKAKVWEWDSKEYFNTTNPEYFHTNSIDVHPVTGNIVFSMRHPGCAMAIDYSTKDVIWVLQGNNPIEGAGTLQAIRIPNKTQNTKFISGSNILGEPTLSGYTWNGISGNHDARWLPDVPPLTAGNQVFSIWDDGTYTAAPQARGVIYEINTTTGKAIHRSSVFGETGAEVSMGSYTVLKNDSGAFSYTLCAANAATITEWVGAVAGNSKTKVLKLTTNGAVYRYVKVKPTHFTLANLRSCWTQRTAPPAFDAGGGGAVNNLTSGLQAYWK